VLQVRELIVNVHLCCVYTGNLVSGVVAVATAKDRATDSQVIGNCPHSSLSFVIRAFIVLQSVHNVDGHMLRSIKLVNS